MRVAAVHRSARHDFSKESVPVIKLLPGVGVEGDAHAGRTVQHRSRIRRDPHQPNLRQVHLLHGELLDELDVEPGRLGENITTRDLDLLALSAGSLLRLGDDVVVQVTGLRNPCVQIDTYRPGLLSRVVSRQAGRVVRRAGVMGIVLVGGQVRPGHAIVVTSPDEHVALEPV